VDFSSGLPRILNLIIGTAKRQVIY
jgi:hypothetical protein